MQDGEFKNVLNIFIEKSKEYFDLKFDNLNQRMDRFESIVEKDILRIEERITNIEKNEIKKMKEDIDELKHDHTARIASEKTKKENVGFVKWIISNIPTLSSIIIGIIIIALLFVKGKL